MSASPKSKHSKLTINSSRALALQTLLTVEQQKAFVDETFHQLIQQVELSKEDRALAFELVNGVLRHRGYLDWRLNGVTDRPFRGLPTIVAMILRLGAYQLLYLDRIPESAAVNESVKLAKRIKGRDWSGVVNGVLRNLIRKAEPSQPDLTEVTVQALSIRYSCPTWLTQRWFDRLGPEKTERLCRQTTGIPPLTLRTNTLRCSREDLKTRLQDEGYTVAQTEISPFGLTLEKCGSLTTIEALQEGWCYVEDEAAQLVPLLLDVQPGQRVLDACAAPGGKTTHMAQLMNDQGEIVAIDRSPDRIKILQKNVERLGMTCILTQVGSWTESPPESSHVGPLLKEGFDRILLDVPCSGLGVIRRHPEAKWQRTAEQLPHHQTVQREILAQVCTHLRPGGVLVYSSCSAEPEETTQTISQFCLDHPEFQRENSAPFLPPGSETLTSPDGDLLTLGSIYDMDGFFAARLRRAS